MKRFFQTALTLLFIFAITDTAFSQRKLKEGSVIFEMNMDSMENSPELAMMNGTTLTFYFKDQMQKMDMNMMDGMMRIQTIIPMDNPKEGCMLMDMMGQKIQVTDMNEEQLSKNNNFMNMDNVKEIKYDEKNRKEIAGYPCYFAEVTTNDNMTMKYYITEKIQPPMPVVKKGEDANILKGYPLEMTVNTGQGMEMTFTAKEVSKEVPAGVLEVPEGYEKMPMEEFEKQMGGMMGGMGN